MDYWKRKLSAYLHDPPSKVLDLRGHEEHAKRLYAQAGISDEQDLQNLKLNFAKESDWTAAAADRFPFPISRGRLSSVFDGVRAGFHHPMSPSARVEARYRFAQEFASEDAAKDGDQSVQPIIDDQNWSDPALLWKARYFSHWRLWEQFCTERDYRFALLPADTRIPDHTIWTHMQVVSALDGCATETGDKADLRPAFLKFQLGGVQDFISQARSVRDLWSGSYLLSWLMCAGLKALAWEIGPDAVIFPNLKGQPIFDLHLRDDLWSKIVLNKKSGWDHLKPIKRARKLEDVDSLDLKALLTPNLPNVFLAVVPADRAEELGQLVETAIQEEWHRIASVVFDFTEAAGMFTDSLSADERKQRFDRQVNCQLELTWQATPWPKTLVEVAELADGFEKSMPVVEARKRVDAVVKYATETMPEADRDSRNYADPEGESKRELGNVGLAWSILVALNGWQLDAVRQLKPFAAWAEGRVEASTTLEKDSLGGVAEHLLGGPEARERASKLGGPWRGLFKHDDYLGAANLIKRVWHLAYLRDRWELPIDSKSFPMPDTRLLAQGEQNKDDSGEPSLEGGTVGIDDTGSGSNYYAVLALDGDSIGKWVSGENTPKLQAQFSSYFDGQKVQAQGAVTYFEQHAGQSLLDTNRPLSPSYHLQFSAALSNFALLCTRRIVEHFEGRLIYSGGDDVLAMLPASTGLDCARALRAAFRGEDPGVEGIQSLASGYLGFDDHLDYSTNHPIPVIVPGPAADCSVGIAISHFKSPLQDAVRAARTAEKSAKLLPNKAAVAFTVIKRSGETVEWAAKWDSQAIPATRRLLKALHENVVSAKFPYRLAELLEGFQSRRTNLASPLKPVEGFNLPDVFARSLKIVLERQRGPGWQFENRGADFENGFTSEMTDWLRSMTGSPEQIDFAIRQLLGFCAFCGFAKRHPETETSNSTAA